MTNETFNLNNVRYDDRGECSLTDMQEVYGHSYQDIRDAIVAPLHNANVRFRNINYELGIILIYDHEASGNQLEISLTEGIITYVDGWGEKYNGETIAETPQQLSELIIEWYFTGGDKSAFDRAVVKIISEKEITIEEVK